VVDLAGSNPGTGSALVARTVELIDIASESFAEAELVAHLETVLAPASHLSLDRVGDNLVARTTRGRSRRLVLAGHTDTVPANGNARAEVRGGEVWGLGSADMKAGLAVMVELALGLAQPDLDVTYVFYAREEVAGRHSGLEELFVARPDLLVGDAAILGEPTAGRIEAGCQGTLRALLTLVGERAHTARPWMGRNAIHRLGPVLAALAAHTPRRPVVGGLTFREALEAVHVAGGVAGNVVPDRVELTVNHRFAPDRDTDAAFEAVRSVLGPFQEAGDTLELVEASPAGVPAVDHPLLAALVRRSRAAVEAKLGWTDVARFSARGVPAVNFGPGDSTLAHRADERVDAARIAWVHDVLAGLLTGGA
jgi:succinyl-diaminopimelate desuccinylase